MPSFDSSDLIGRTFLQYPNDDVTRFCARIIEAINENKEGCTNDPQFIKFRCSTNDGEFEEVVAYNDIINHIEREMMLRVENGDSSLSQATRVHSQQEISPTKVPDTMFWSIGNLGRALMNHFTT